MYPHSALAFYEIMKYPVPHQQEFFLFNYKKKEEQLKRNNAQQKSYPESALMSEYLERASQARDKLLNVPFIEQIYLCNSTTFNALHEQSDIDFTFVVTKKRIRTTKLMVTLKLFYHKFKRYKKDIRKQICTSFFITQDNQNLYPIKLPNSPDIYLIYRLAHLVPLYSRGEEDKSSLLQANDRIKNFLPNHPLHQTIRVEIGCHTGTSKIKKRREKILSGMIGSLVETIIKNIRLIIISIKRKKDKNPNGIILSDQMLKFHDDKRHKIQFLFDLSSKKK